MAGSFVGDLYDFDEEGRRRRVKDPDSKRGWVRNGDLDDPWCPYEDVPLFAPFPLLRGIRDHHPWRTPRPFRLTMIERLVALILSLHQFEVEDPTTVSVEHLFERTGIARSVFWEAFIALTARGWMKADRDGRWSFRRIVVPKEVVLPEQHMSPPKKIPTEKLWRVLASPLRQCGDAKNRQSLRGKTIALMGVLRDDGYDRLDISAERFNDSTKLAPYASMSVKTYIRGLADLRGARWIIDDGSLRPPFAPWEKF